MSLNLSSTMTKPTESSTCIFMSTMFSNIYSMWLKYWKLDLFSTSNAYDSTCDLLFKYLTIMSVERSSKLTLGQATILHYLSLCMYYLYIWSNPSVLTQAKFLLISEEVWLRTVDCMNQRLIQSLLKSMETSSLTLDSTGLWIRPLDFWQIKAIHYSNTCLLLNLQVKLFLKRQKHLFLSTTKVKTNSHQRVCNMFLAVNIVDLCLELL